MNSKKTLFIIIASIICLISSYILVSSIVSLVQKQYVTGSFYTLPGLIVVLVISSLIAITSIAFIIFQITRKE